MVVGQCFDVRDSLEALHDRFMYILISIIIIFIVDAISFNNFDLIILKRAPMSLIIYLFFSRILMGSLSRVFFPICVTIVLMISWHSIKMPSDPHTPFYWTLFTGSMNQWPLYRSSIGSCHIQPVFANSLHPDIRIRWVCIFSTLLSRHFSFSRDWNCKEKLNANHS